MIEPAIELINAIAPLEDEAISYLKENLLRYSVPKKHLLVKAGRTNRSVYVIRQGIIRVFRIVDGQEFTTWIFSEGHFAVSLEGFYAKQTCEDNLEMIEDGEVSEITGEVMDYLCERYLSFNHFYRRAVDRSHYLVVKHMLQLQTLKYDVVFENFISNSPELMLRVPQKYIASFLGMHEKHFTRLKNEFLRKSNQIIKNQKTN